MNLKVKEIYQKNCKISDVENIDINVYETEIMKCERKFKIKKNVFIIKRANKFMFNYLLCKIKKRKLIVIANSDSVDFLQTFAISRFAVEDNYYND